MAWYNPFSWLMGKEAPPDASGTGQVLRAHDLNDKDPQRRAAAIAAYDKNYQNLYDQMDDKWRAALVKMASSPTGKEIIANMPENVKVNSDAFILKFLNFSALYNPNFNKLNLGKEGELIDFMHESRHAMQDHLGHLTRGGNYSLEERALCGMLIEADAYSVTEVEMYIDQALGTYNPTPEQIKEFMKKDLLKEKIPPEVWSRMNADERKEYLNSQKNNPDYQLQQALIKNGGNLNKTRQQMRQDEFKKYWENGELGSLYEKQTLNNIIYQIERGSRPGEENKNRVNQIYEQIAKDHGVSVEEVKKNLKVSPAFQKSLDYMAAHPNAKPDELIKTIDGFYKADEKKYDKNRDGLFSLEEYTASTNRLKDPNVNSAPVAQAEQSSGGFGSWFRNSWFGRLIGVNDQPQEPVTPEQPAEQNSALASGAETRGQTQPAQTAEVDKGPSDATRTLASAGQRYQEQRDVSQYQRGAGRDA